MQEKSETLIIRVYRYLGRIKTARHAFLVSMLLACMCGLLSILGTLLVVQTLNSHLLPLMKVVAYLLPFTMVLMSSFFLIRSFSLLELRNEVLSEAVERDDLTRLANRAAFYRKGKDMMQQAKERNTPLSLVLLDADHFKKINDTYGHLTGDLALRHLASILRKVSRENDLVARWGGEEFAILLRASGIRGAEIYAERIRKKVAMSPLLCEGKNLHLSLSAGVTQWYEGEDDFESMILRADKALYGAKSAGRNQVKTARLYPEEVEGYEQDVQFEDPAADIFDTAAFENDDIDYRDAVA